MKIVYSLIFLILELLSIKNADAGLLSFLQQLCGHPVVSDEVYVLYEDIERILSELSDIKKNPIFREFPSTPADKQKLINAVKNFNIILKDCNNNFKIDWNDLIIFCEKKGFKLLYTRLGAGASTEFYSVVQINHREDGDLDYSISDQAIGLAAAFNLTWEKQIKKERSIKDKLGTNFSEFVHQNFVSEQGPDRRNAILLSERMKGTLAQSKLSDLSQLKKYLGQAACGIQHLHKQGVYHNDIKPDNILISLDGSTAKIADLGSASLDEKNRKGPFLGTPLYNSPELSDVANPERDVYAFGMTIVDMLSRTMRDETAIRNYHNCIRDRVNFHLLSRCTPNLIEGLKLSKEKACQSENPQNLDQSPLCTMLDVAIQSLDPDPKKNRPHMDVVTKKLGFDCPELQTKKAK
jgi:hypothetical protein